MVSGTISPRYSRYFSPFPHGTGSLSVSQEYLALADGAASFRQGFTGPALLRILSQSISFSVRDSHPVSCIFPDDFLFTARSLCQSYNPSQAVTSLVWAIPASLATTTGITIVFFSCGYLDVSVPHVRPLDYSRVLSLQLRGLPHSDISGSMHICYSPPLFAAYHVLLRL